MYVGPLRFLRAFTVSATCVALSLVMHLIGAGARGVPVVALSGLLLVISVLLTVVLAALSGRRWTLGRSLVALGSGQVGLHAIFNVLLASPHHHGPSATGASTGSGASMVVTALDALAVVRAAVVDGERFTRRQRPRILTDLVVLQGLSRRGPPRARARLLTCSTL